MAARVIALEEHFWTPGLVALRRTVDQRQSEGGRAAGRSRCTAAARDGRGRHRHAGAVGGRAGAQNLTPAQAVSLARASNDLLFEAVKRHPDRFAGFATLPTPDPRSRGAGARAHGQDARLPRLHVARLDPRPLSGRARVPADLRECAQALDVPIYLHPCDAASGGARRLLQGLSAARPRQRSASRRRSRCRRCGWC